MSIGYLKEFFLANIFSGISIGDISFKPTDWLDILLVAILIYAILKLIFETRSFPIILGITTVFIFYGFANILNLSLTRNILQSFLSVFIILIAIIFQSEFRRFLTFFNLAPRLSKQRLPSQGVISILSETIRYLADRKMGALFVFPGRESIDNHLVGGFNLDGEVSEPLLVSIFDDSTPGHDGAVILEGNRLKKFGVHLPLARNIDAVKGYGTRHRAGLGLSERSDALVVIVSEERGSISIARNGVLKNVKTHQDLEEVVKRFYAEKFPNKNISYIFDVVAKNALLVILTLAIAGGIWIYSNQGSPLVQKKFVVALEYQNVPADLIIGDVVPEETVVTLESKGGNFQKINSDEIRILVDLSNIRTGWRQFLIDPEKIKVPFDFTVVKVDPDKVSLLIQKKNSAASPSVRPRP